MGPKIFNVYSKYMTCVTIQWLHYISNFNTLFSFLTEKIFTIGQGQTNCPRAMKIEQSMLRLSRVTIEHCASVLVQSLFLRGKRIRLFRIIPVKLIFNTFLITLIHISNIQRKSLKYEILYKKLKFMTTFFWKNLGRHELGYQLFIFNCYIYNTLSIVICLYQQKIKCHTRYFNKVKRLFKYFEYCACSRETLL